MERALSVAVKTTAHLMQSVLAADFPACVKQADPPFYFSALKIALSDERTGKTFSHVVCFRHCFN